jgi:signal transduction histidine kinase
MKRTSLDRRLTVAICGTVMSAIVLSLTLNLLFALHGRRVSALEEARSLAQLLAESCGPALDFMDKEAARDDLHSLAVVSRITQATLYTADNKMFASFGKSVPMGDLHGADSLVTLGHFTLSQPVLARGEEVGTLMLYGTFIDQNRWLMRNLVSSGAIMALVLAFSLGAAHYFRRRITKPIGELTRVASDITRTKDYSRRIVHDSDDEVGMLMREFNSMLHEVEQRDRRLNEHRESLEAVVAERTTELRTKQHELEQNNARLRQEARERQKAEMIRDEVERINRHDLKSSLSLVIGYPELLLKRGHLQDEQRMYLKRIESAGYRMLDMIQNHLDMFKMEKGIYVLRRNQVDLVELICSLEEELSLLLHREGVSLRIELDGQPVSGFEILELSGDMNLLRTLFRNLLCNAVEASTRKGVVSVRLQGVNEKVRASIHNDRAVPLEIRERFFDKYVSHGKEDGTGLGTYSARLIAHTHDGSIFMRTDDATGTTVEVVFPA